MSAENLREKYQSLKTTWAGGVDPYLYEEVKDLSSYLDTKRYIKNPPPDGTPAIITCFRISFDMMPIMKVQGELWFIIFDDEGVQAKVFLERPTLKKKISAFV